MSKDDLNLDCITKLSGFATDILRNGHTVLNCMSRVTIEVVPPRHAINILSSIGMQIVLHY